MTLPQLLSLLAITPGDFPVPVSALVLLLAAVLCHLLAGRRLAARILSLLLLLLGSTSLLLFCREARASVAMLLLCALCLAHSRPSKRKKGAVNGALEQYSAERQGEAR